MIVFFFNYFTVYFIIQSYSVGKESACNAGGPGSIPRLGRSPGEGNDNPVCILAWEMSRTEEPGGQQFVGSQKSDTT